MDPRTKRVSLDFIGDGWQDCFVELRYFRWADYKRFVEMEKAHGDEVFDAMIEKIQSVFVSGQVLDGGKPVALTREQIADFDTETLKVLNNVALGYLDPKESSASAPSSESTPTP
jgi:hypothetical protein